MARQSKDKNELVKCEYCGEMYSVTYKHCPFCNEDGTGSWDEPVREEDVYDEVDNRPGKRLASGKGPRKPIPVGSIIYGVISVALITAAAGIVISIVRPLLSTGKGTETPQTEATQTVAATQAPVAEVDPGTLGGEELVTPGGEEQPGTDTPAAPDTPAVVTTQAPAMTTATPGGVTAPTDFTLNRTDFTLDHAGETFRMKATYTPGDARGDITWTSSDANIAAVSWDGTVTAVSPGTVEITANVAGVGEKKCIVRCSFTAAAQTPSTSGTAASSGSSAGSSTSGITLSREDFTLSKEGDSWRLTVKGSSSTPTWTSSNTSVATVGADGTVTAVAPGTCTVTATVDGMSAKCIVRCTFS